MASVKQQRDPEKMPWYGWLLFGLIALYRIVHTHF